MELIDRPLYTNQIEPFIGKGLIKVLTGQRRVGKSCILAQLMKMVAQRRPDANVVCINMEYEEFRTIRTDRDLYEFLRDKLPKDRDNYLFIDEIQDIAGFEYVLRDFQAREICDMFITGSNAKMMSSELSTYLSGRYIEFHVHSLSYMEFLTFHKLSDNNRSLALYLTYGGMPYLSRLELTDELAFEYLRNVYSTIFLKDVVKREGIRNIDFLETLGLYIADNIGNLFSANNISKYLKSQRTEISVIQVINYLKAMRNAFIINKVERMDVNGLKIFEIGDKYYYEDLGLRNCQLGFSLQRDIHKLMENAVYLHLRQLRYDVYVGRLDKREIDFVGITRGKRVYVQVAYLLVDAETKEREFGNLMAIPDNYPKYVVTMDEFNLGGLGEKGIHHLHLADFLKLKEL